MNIFSILLLFTSFFITVLAIYSFKFRGTASGRYFFLLLFSVALFSFSYAFEIDSQRIFYKIFWLKASYLGLSTIAPLFLLFVLSFTGKEKYITPWLIGLIVVLPIFTLLANYTNEMHHLYYTDIWVKDVGMFSVLVLIRGVLYWPLIAYTTLFNLIAVILLIDIIIKKRGSFRTQSVLILLSTLPPWFINALYLLRESPDGVDFSAFGFMFTAIFISFALFNYHLLGFIPIALENVFSSMHDGVILLDSKNRIMNYNPAANCIFKSLGKEVIGENVNRLSKEQERLLVKIEEKNNEVFTFSMDNNNSLMYVQAKVMPIMDKRDMTIGQAVMLYDITEETISREKLRVSNETKDKLFSIVAHDLRGPMGNMMNLLTLINEQYDSMDTSEIKEMMKILDSQTQTTYRLIENLLYWSRSQLGQIVRTLQNVKVKTLISEVTDILSPSLNAKEISVELQIDEDVEVLADVEMSRIVFRNILSNSVKYCNIGGVVTVSAHKKGNNIGIVIEDNGIGMSEAILASLFSWTKERSVPGTNREPGSRLGLILCKEFVEKQGGSISAESEYGKWSRFTVTLPSASQEQIS
ncbi:MAG: histidine kinase N-terminal 7TM domain-containing protein [Bacteroidales bacterium]|nr:histidine kinase N-terminal 7TM domain-containing protein [Bacteroidales bacterium]